MSKCRSVSVLVGASLAIGARSAPPPQTHRHHASAKRFAVPAAPWTLRVLGQPKAVAERSLGVAVGSGGEGKDSPSRYLRPGMKEVRASYHDGRLVVLELTFRQVPASWRSALRQLDVPAVGVTAHEEARVVSLRNLKGVPPQWEVSYTKDDLGAKLVFNRFN